MVLVRCWDVFQPLRHLNYVDHFASLRNARTYLSFVFCFTLEYFGLPKAECQGVYQSMTGGFWKAEG